MAFRKNSSGFTLIEVLIFIIISGLLLTTVLIGSNFSLLNSPQLARQQIALQTARQCMEALLMQKRLAGLGSCPSTPSNALCTAPSGYTLSTNLTCATWNGDNSYQTLTVTIGGQSSASLSMQLGKY